MRHILRTVGSLLLKSAKTTAYMWREPTLRPFAHAYSTAKEPLKAVGALTPLSNASVKETAPVAAALPRLIGLEAFFEGGRALPPVPKEKELPTAYGRAWRADELRLKSFSDLHGLWFVLLREVNLLATQRAEAKRTRLRWPHHSRLFKCRQSMARIKTVLTERMSLYRAARRATGRHVAPRVQPAVDATKGDGTETLAAPPVAEEGTLLQEWHRSEKMRQLWRKREFRKRMNYRRNRSSLFV